MTISQKKDAAVAALLRLEEAAEVLRRSVRHVALDAAMLDRITEDANTSALGLEILAEITG